MFKRYPAILLLTCGTLFSSAPILAQAVTPVNGTPIQLPVNDNKTSPYFALQIPIALYPQSADSHLSDLKLRNAKGDFLNYAWLDQTEETVKLASHTLPIFPVLSHAENDQSAIKISRQSDGSLVAQTQPLTTEKNMRTISAWIIDASKLNSQSRYIQARVRIDKDFQGIAPLRIEASEDFTHWTSLSNMEKLVQLQHQNEQIQKLSINLHHSYAKYLRLTWLPAAQAAPPILSLEIDTQEQASIAPKMQWTAPIKASQCDALSCEYAVPARTPIDSLRLHLAEKNTLARVAIFGELPPTISPTKVHHHFRNPLYVLRHQKQLSATPTAQTIFLGDITAYRLEQADGEITTEDFALNAYAFNKIRLQVPAGLKSLGANPPTITLGSLTRSLVFIARGDAPYSIVFSPKTKEGTALEVATLMPNMKLHETTLPLAEVSPTSLAPTARLEHPASSGSQIAAADLAKNKAQNRYWLWAALVAALLILGGMVWSLLGKIDSEKT